jgi:diadenosine tetraphosphate (Ap4A) HIT family hydrolase
VFGDGKNARMKENVCVFCDLTQFRAAEVCIENDVCLYASTRDPLDPPDVLPGTGVIIPKAHRASPFDFTADEWAATHELLVKAKEAQDERLAPDGYTLIWNCFSEIGQPRYTRTCTSSLASTTSRLQTEAVGRPSRCLRTGGLIPRGAGAGGRARSGEHPTRPPPNHSPGTRGFP